MNRQKILTQLQQAAKMAQAALDEYTETGDSSYLERLEFWVRMYRYWMQLLEEGE